VIFVAHARSVYSLGPSSNQKPLLSLTSDASVKS
jgi:hypothetical protein